ncbi:putative ribosome-binding factor A, mitochondrial [Plecturocebus cupreus]
MLRSFRTARGDCVAPLSPARTGSRNLPRKPKKKFWYEVGIPHEKHPKETKKEDHVRTRALNGLLCKALTNLLCAHEVSQELYDLNVELSKVSLTPDFSACGVYWKTTLSAEQNARVEAVLQKSAAYMSYWQFGPPDQRDDFVRNVFRNPDAPRPCGTTEPATSSSLCGINHEALNKQIMEYKRRKDKGLGGLVWQGQVAELTMQMKKGRKKAKPSLEQDSSLKSYLLGEGEDDLDLDGAPPYERYALDTEELEAKRRAR